MANGSLTCQETARLLLGARQVQVFSHRSPDGDTLGSGFALCRMLEALGCEAWLCCPDPVPPRFSYLGQTQPPREDAPLTVAVDVADAALLGSWTVLAYLPYLVVAGAASGLFTGLCAQLLAGRLKGLGRG